MTEENPQPDQHFYRMNRDEAQQHLQGLLDQASVVFRPEGFEVLHTVDEEGHEHFVAAFQRTWNSAMSCVVVIMSRSDMVALADSCRSVVDDNVDE